MQSDVLVSVIVPTYNHEKYIEQCLESIATQATNFNFEIIVGDDFSTDRTREKIKSVAERFPGKFNLLFHEKNLGPKEAPGKNNSIACIHAAKGKYIAFCEGDDFWTDSGKLQQQVDFLENNKDYNICFHKISVISEDKNYEYETPDDSIPDTTSAEDLLRQGNFIHTATCVLRNPQVDVFPAWYYQMMAGDYAFYLLSLKEKKIKFLPVEMAAYRIHGGGAWSSNTKIVNYNREIESFKILYGVFERNRELIKNSIYNRYLFIADYYRKNGDAGETLKFELKTILFCISYRYKPNRSHIGLAMDVVKDFLWHKLKLS